MRVPWRTLALAAALIVAAAVNPAPAQTVIVTKAPPGASLELALNQTTVQTGTADDKGVGTLPFTVPGLAKTKDQTTEAAVRVFVDICEGARRVTLVEAGWQPSAAVAGCARHELFGTFAVRPGLTTLVVDTAAENQSVWIRQGKPPSSWTDPNFEPDRDSVKPEWQMATGLVLFGGAGIGKVAEFANVGCGLNSGCTAADLRLTFRAGAEFWLGRYLAISGSYLKPLKAEAAGSGTGYTFSTRQVSDIITATGKVAIPFGRVRLYGEGGALYHHTTLTTDQTMEDRVVTINDTPTTFPGGTQVFLLQTAGWGWIVGGGGEVWLNKRFALFGDIGRAKLKGSPRAGGEGQIDDILTYVVGGLRFHLGK